MSSHPATPHVRPAFACQRDARGFSNAKTMLFIDWLARIKQHVESDHAELNLAGVAPGDLVRVVTKNTLYTLRVLDDERSADLTTNREDRPSGIVKIMGCTFGLSSTISPERLFCGGNLEFNFLREGVRFTHTTSSIRTIQWVRRAA